MNEDTETITCRDTTWLVSASCERELTEAEIAALKGHISECELCQGASTQFEVLFRQLKQFFSDSGQQG